MSHAIRANHAQRLLLAPSLDEWVPAQHPARFVRDLVDSLDLKELGLRQSPGEEGRPHYAVELLLSVWLYGWMERIRSSRALEKACLRDVVFMWLTGQHHPDHSTLWRFWRDNRQVLRALFKRVVQVAVQANLVGFVLHALDGTKIPTVSSMETALHRKTLEEQLRRLDAIVDTAVDQTDADEELEDASYAMPTELHDPEARKQAIRAALAKLDEAETKHLHPNEPEARVTKTRTGRTLAYNAQAVVDHDSDLIVAAEVCSDETDHAQLVPMLEAVRETSGRDAEHTVADTGYCSGEQLDSAEKKDFNAIVRMQEEARTKGDYSKSHFRYDAERDAYLCPRGELLPLESLRKPTTTSSYPIATYRCHNSACPVRADCTKDKLGRSIKRTPYEQALARHWKKLDNPALRNLLSLRKEIVEHIFGIAKGIDGFRRFTVRGLDKARAQWALLCTAINLRKLLAYWYRGELSLPPRPQPGTP